MVKFGEWEVPLIGIPKESTQEQCEGCKQYFHLSEIALDADGKPRCAKCLAK